MTALASAEPSISKRDKILAADLVNRLSTEEVNYTHEDRSFSPFWSNIGLTFGRDCGIDALHFHYNRRTVTIGNGVLAMQKKASKRDDSVTHASDDATSIAFFNTDAFILESAENISYRLFDNEVIRVITDKTDENGIRHLHCMMKNTDERDPDPEVPVLISIRVFDGVINGTSIEKVNGQTIKIAFHFDLLDIDRQKAVDILMQCPDAVSGARIATYKWLLHALNDLSLYPEDEYESQVLSRAILTLLFNTVSAPGLLEGRLSSFPSRGGYPTHFLWDALFHNLALEYMAPELAEDALLILSDTMRKDGLMAHFVCSTWIRPIASQPPLYGWAAERLINKTGDLSLAEEALEAMTRNTEWWLTQRMTKYGLISCFDPFETGWDDTPRLDDGPIVATDMNAYLLMQMRSATRIANLLGKEEQGIALKRQADDFASLMVEVLYNEDSGRFHDLRIETGEKLDILTPAVFLPLLGDIPIPIDKQTLMIKNYLFDESRMFGKIPFPCVAYDDPDYDRKTMWRGPMWLPISWLLLELLEKLGFEEERNLCERKLYNIVLRDGNMHEYFDSQDGAGLGYPQQGWTAAIFIRLHLELVKHGA